jgi:hypothetical protein
MDQPPPEVLALVVADHVHRDDETRKVFVLGTRSVIGARTFPWPHPALAVYLALAGGRGESTLRICLVDVDEERDPVAEGQVVVAFPDPLYEVDFAMFLADLVFPEPGDYRVQLYADGRFLLERRLLVMPLENPDVP